MADATLGLGASTFQVFTANDKTSTRTLLHEAIPITGAICSASAYNEGGTANQRNIKAFPHGMWQALHDYPYLSSSANHIVDFTCGYSSDSSLSSSASVQNSKKIRMYNQMAQVLAGFDRTGSVRQFDEDGDLTAGTKIKEAYFVSFSRLLTKDELKKGSFEMQLGTTGALGRTLDGKNFGKMIKVVDKDAATNYFTNSPAGDYSILYATSSHASATQNSTTMKVDTGTEVYHKCGLLYYQAGIAVLSASLFEGGQATATIGWGSTCSPGDTITVTSTDGTVVVYTAHDDTTGGSGAAVTFDRVTTNKGAEGFLAAIALSSHAGKITGVVGTDNIVLTQAAGASGNTTIVNASAAVTINGGASDADGSFTGGSAGLLKYDAPVQGPTSTSEDINAAFSGSTIETNCDNIRNRISNIKFNNTTELNSTQYFCRANHNSFNYSANPTYLSQSKIRVRSDFDDLPVTYITTVGLYSADNELMAVAKLSEPLKKDPSTELTIRVRLDY